MKWISPSRQCASSSFPITKYKDINDITWASHKVTDSNCKGIWTAEVTTKKGVLLAKQEINISDFSKKEPTNKVKNYTAINHWNECTSIKRNGYSKEICLPSKMPKSCTTATWNKLGQSNITYC